jgi:23S rRNA pseudouridine1911/1915/1917 synthase
MLNIKILKESLDFLGVEKPPGILVHPVINNYDEETVASFISSCYPEVLEVGDDPIIRPGIVHRLDRDTSGVFIVARTQQFFDYFKKLLQKREVKKTYIALVCGVISNKKTIDTPIGLKKGSVKRSAIPRNAATTARKKKLTMIKEAITDIEPIYNYICDGNKYTLVKAYPKTGRTHQIRVHLASIGHPIVGDKVYGKGRGFVGIKRHFLHSKRIEFIDNNGCEINITTPLPDDLKNFIKDCAGDRI